MLLYVSNEGVESIAQGACFCYSESEMAANCTIAILYEIICCLVIDSPDRSDAQPSGRG